MSDFVVVISECRFLEDLVGAIFVVGDSVGDLRGDDGVARLEVRIANAIRESHATNGDT